MKLAKKLEAEIMQVYETWLNAYINGDVKTYNFYLDVDYRFIGSTNNEEFLNRNDTTKFFEKTAHQLAGKTDLKNRNKTVELFEGLVIITEFFDAYFLIGKEWTYYGRFRFTSAMRKNKEGWRFVYQHFSMPDSKAQDGETLGSEQISKENQELRDAIKRRTFELEQKNRELEVEKSLEKVRGVAMGMHRPDDMLDVCKILFYELQSLGFDELRNTLINSFVDEKEYFINYDYSDATGGSITQIPFKGHPAIEKFIRNIRKSKNAFDHLAIEGKELNDWIAFRKTNNELEDPRLEGIKSLHYYNYSIGTSGIGISTYRAITKEKQELLQRFRNVFSLAYQRYTDISLAEAQAREAQIELALERVRSRTMAMQRSNDLQEAALLMFGQMEILGLPQFGCGFNIWDKDRKAATAWMGSEKGLQPSFKTDSSKDIYLPIYKAAKKSESLFVIEQNGKELAAHYKYLASIPTFRDIIMKDFEQKGISLPSSQIIHCAFFAQGYLMFITYESAIAYYDIFTRFAKVFQQTYTRFLDLQKAEAQAREAQIETALERVRSRTMAMQHSDELQEASFLLDQQVRALGIKTWGCAFNIYGEKDSTEWFGNEAGVLPTYKVPRKGIFKEYYQKGQKGESLHIKEFSGEKCVAHYEYMSSLPIIGDVLKKLKEKNNGFPTYQIDHVVYFKYGYLLFITREDVPDAHDIFKRFAKVFEQTYTRFLDLQKAEAQAREAQIEAALERVRSRTMAMQKSSELAETSIEMLKQMQALGMRPWACGFNIFEKDEKAVTQWMSAVDGSLLTPFTTPLTEDPFFIRISEARQRGEELFVMESGGHELEETYKYMFSLPAAKTALGDILAAGFDMPKFQITHCAFFSQGYLMFITYEPYPEAHDIFRRFAKVFEQTYTRFLDLQKAEAQAREAQIEGALEKVRSRTMAMQHSDELPEAANTLFLEVQALGIPAWSCGYNILSEDKKSSNCIMSSEGELQEPFVLPLTQHKSLKPWYKAIINDNEFFVYGQKGKGLVEHYKYMESLPELKGTFELFEKAGLKLPKQQFNHLVRFNEGFLLFITYEEVPGAHDIFKRFGKVFEQTYTRFLDLQKAEAQARESEIELALERIRARTMAMHKSEELKDVIQVVYNQFIQLKIDIEHTGFIIDYKQNEDMHIWLADKNAVFPKIILPYFDCAHWNSFKDTKKKGKDFFVNHLSFKEKNKFYKDLFRFIPDVPKEAKDHYFSCPGLAISTVLIDNVGLYIENFKGIPYSEEENSILMRFGKVFQQTYTRFLDLQKAEAQAREAQIETALERIRSRSMAMQKSNELLEAGELLWNEITKLGIDCFTSGYVLMDDMEDIGWNYTPNPSTGKILELAIGIPHKQTPPLRKIVAEWKKQEPLCVIELTRKQTIAHQTFVAEKGINFPFSAKELVKISPKEIVLHTFNFKQGYLLIVGGEKISKNQINLMLRFTKVFQQTYTRFLDLKKAESQAREAKIEASLERIRSHSMGMQSSGDLSNVTNEMFTQLRQFGGDLYATGIVFCDKHEGLVEQWHSIPKAGMTSPFLVPIDLDYIHKYRYDEWKKGTKLFSVEIPSDFIKQHFEAIFNLPSTQKVLKEFEDQNTPMPAAPSWEIDYGASFKHGYLLASSLQPFKEAEILPRFAKVFEQTYTRFLDLKKAEAQAREAKIEAALEKVRSRSLAMHKPDELQEVVAIVAEKLQELGVILDAGGVIICTYFSDNKDVMHWISASDFSHSGSYLLPYFDNPIFNETWASKTRGDTYFSKEFSFKIKNSFFEHAFKNSDYKNFPDEFKDFILQTENHALSFAWQKHSAILVPSHSGVTPSEDDAEIMKRFAKVFEQAYIRFMDLQKAESQAREANKQASLDRVRGQISSMRSTGDLDRITPLIWNELTTMDVPFIRCGVFIMDESTKIVDVHLSAPDGHSLAIMSLPFSANPFTKNTIEYWQRKKVYREHWNREEFLDFMKSMMELGQIQSKETFQDAESPPESLDLHFVPFKQGMLYVGAENPLNDKQIELVQSLADAFAMAYARYEDFTKLEKAKRSVENALSELKATQNQLIQSEKMASLGELTAGIAHEIQNPLNFVNNFSEVSNELIDEMNEEIDKGDLEEAKFIAKDIKQNLEKINHHGKRADAIVKGMLQHSRSSKVEKEPTDINKLADEYLRLAYHGLRAKDKSFNAMLKTDFDETIGKINIIPQDIGRVILNLITNAFYVVSERSKIGEEAYEPAVWVSTKKSQNKIEIKVKDNGSGIPDKIKEKIFQPFFTTKPTGQGTGLGLSLSYDIVKSHGGEFKVETKEGDGTTFIIILPI